MLYIILTFIISQFNKIIFVTQLRKVGGNRGIITSHRKPKHSFGRLREHSRYAVITSHSKQKQRLITYGESGAQRINHSGRTVTVMSVITLTSNNFNEEVLNSSVPVLVDFWATWCGPCRMVSPIVDQIADERSDVKVGKVNVDEETDLAAKYGVMSIPTLMVFKDGKAVSTSVGARPKDDIEAMFDK